MSHPRQRPPTLVIEPAPEPTAMDRWYEHRSGGGMDRVSVSVWCPSSLPSAYLDTATNAEGHDYFPNSIITGRLNIAGVQIGGPLDDLELLLAAAVEAVELARTQADAITAAQDRRAELEQTS